MHRASRYGKTRKTQTLQMGPYRLLEFTQGGTKEAMLCDLVTGKRFRSFVEHLRPFTSSGEQDDKMLEQLAAKTRDDEYTIEELVSHRPLERYKKIKKLKLHHCEFLVHWLGYQETGSWEKYSDLCDTEALDIYLDKHWPGHA